MDMRNSNAKPLIAWIDHEHNFLNETIARIGQLKLTRSTMKPLNDSIDLFPITVEPIEPVEKLEERAAESITKYCPHPPDLVLVDLSFGKHEDPEAVHIGRGLARGLQKRLFPTPVGVYTQK
jgi:hypothetical protein